MSEPLPNVQLVALQRCVLHESVDPQRVTRLAAALRHDDLLRNPPIVAPLPGRDELVVLDGATRTTALRELGYGAVAAQIVRYSDPRIELHTWVHVLHGLSAAALTRGLRSIAGLTLRPIEAEQALRDVRAHAAAGVLLTAAGAAWALCCAGSLVDEARILNAMFAWYARQATVQRLPHDAHFGLASLPADSVAVIFPRYSKSELLELAAAGAVLPGGITRHIIPGRALRVNVPLQPLREGSFALQQRWFAAWFAERIAGGHARLYTEPTWLFDE